MDIKRPYFSVIIPCYNVEEYVEKCIESLLSQTIGLDNLELIFVDDCSTDNTYQIIADYEKKYSDNIILAQTPTNSRQGAARNIGLDLASGKYISFADADDWLRVDAYEILKKIIDDTDCDVVQFGFKYIAERSAIEPEIDVKYDVYTFEDERKHIEFLINTTIMDESCWKKVYRHKMIKEAQVRYIEGGIYEEPTFTYPLKYYVNKICKTDAELYYYWKNTKGTLLFDMKDPARIKDHLLAQLYIFNCMCNSKFYEKYKNEIQFKFIFSFLYEPFCFFKMRNQIYSVSVLRYVVEKLKSMIPDCQNNFYVNNITEFKYLKKLVYDFDKILMYDDKKLQQYIIDFEKEIEL